MATEVTSEAPERPPRLAPIDLAAFPCPRCEATMSAEYYGPCESCCADLRATMAGEGGDVQAAAYEPKMNVTPNAVALKD